MTSSGYKRGLATAAVSAMAITGLPFFAGAASADTLNDQAGGANAVNLVTFDGHAHTSIVSTKNDGQNTTFRLEAVAGSNVSQIRFEYQFGAATPVTIATVSRNDDGAFSTEWPAAGLAGAAITVRAVALAADGSALGEDHHAVTVNNAAETLNVTDGAALGVFQAPYTGHTGNFVGIAGTASSDAVVNLEWFDTGGFVADGSATPSGTDHAWARVIDITGYTFGATDQLMISADNGQTDDTEAYTLYKQQITTVTAVPDKTDVPAGQTAEVTVTVADQNGKPIAGAQVFSSNGGVAQYTDQKGHALFTQNAGAAGNAYYYANATNSTPYEPELGDKKSDTVAITQYVPVQTTLAASSRDGAAFDLNEYDADDITVQVKDQKGTNYDTTAQAVNYYWVFTPFGGGATVRTPASGTTAQAVETGGKFVIPMPNSGSGTYDLFAALGADGSGNGDIASSKVLTVKAGQASFSFAEAEPEQAVIGGDEVVAGKLALEDGTGLPGRPVTMSTTGGTAAFNQASGPDAPSYATTTDANGGFSGTLDDPDADTTGEVDQVNVATTSWVHSGDTDNAGADTSTDDPAVPGVEDDPQEVQFVYSVTPGSITFADTGDADLTGPGTPESAGDLQDFTVTVKSQDNPATPADESVPLTNQDVTLTVDHGYLTDGIPQGAAGTDAGVYDNDGQTKTYTTDANGQIVVKTSIGRDAGFDDDGDVTATLTAAAGPASKAQAIQWTSENPMNGGSVEISLAPAAQQQSGVLPKAPISDQVRLLVKAFDQFGNRVGGESVSLSDNLADPSATVTNATTDYDEQYDATADSEVAGDMKVTASWTTETTKLLPDGADAGSDADLPGTLRNSGNETLTDDTTINWYTVDWANSTVTLENDAADPADVGSTVIVTYTAIDQFGEPVTGWQVGFFRTGPDVYQDGEWNSFDTLGQDGMGTYVFSGAQAGQATVAAIAGHVVGGNLTEVEPDSRAETTVQFGTTPPPEPISVTLNGKDNGANDDVLKVVTDVAAQGADVTLYKVKKDGTKVELDNGVIDANGKHKFVVDDKNGNEYTKYRAKVFPTDVTQGGKDSKKVR